MKHRMSEMQVMVTELIPNFEFTIPDSKPRILVSYYHYLTRAALIPVFVSVFRLSYSYH